LLEIQTLILGFPTITITYDMWSSLRHYVSSQSFYFLSNTQVTRGKVKEKTTDWSCISRYILAYVSHVMLCTPTPNVFDAIYSSVSLCITQAIYVLFMFQLYCYNIMRHMYAIIFLQMKFLYCNLMYPNMKF